MIFFIGVGRLLLQLYFNCNNGGLKSNEHLLNIQITPSHFGKIVLVDFYRTTNFKMTEEGNKKAYWSKCDFFKKN